MKSLLAGPNAAGASQGLPASSRSLPVPPLVLAGLTILWLVLINQLRVEWSINPQYTYGWAVPFLAGYLFGKRWVDRPAPAPGRWSPLWIGIAFFLLALLLPIRLVQEANPDWRLISWLAAMEVVSITLAAFWHAGGRPWLAHFALPIAFIVLAVPWPSLFEQRVTQGLMRLIAGLSVEILNWCGVPAVRQGNLIELSTGLVGINEACSGIRSFQGMCMAAIFLGEVYRLEYPRRLLLIATGSVLALLFNLVRTLFLIWMGLEHGPEAIRGWHDPAGYLVLAATFLLLWAFCHRTRQRAIARPSARPIEPGVRPFPAVAIRAAMIWLVLVELSTEAWYRSREPAHPRGQAWAIRWPNDTAHFHETPISKEIRVILRYNQGKSGIWLRPDGTEWLFYFFRWSPGRAAAQLAKNHSPEICLPANGLKMVSDLGLRTVSLPNITLPVRAFTFEVRGRPLYVFYCLWEDQPQSSNHLDISRMGRFRAVWEARRHLGEQVLEVVVTGVVNQAQAEKQFEIEMRELIQVNPAKPS